MSENSKPLIADVNADVSANMNADVTPNFDTLVATLLYLMSRYQRAADEGVRCAIIDHLGMLEQHPEADSPSLRKLGPRLKNFWQSQTPGRNRDQASSEPGTTPSSHRKVLH